MKLTAKSPGDREFDEILSNNTGNMSEEEFLPAGAPRGSPSQHHGKEPIPANRAALIRHIETENRQLRERQRLRELGYKALLVISTVVSIALLTIAIWLFYVAWTGHHAGLTQDDLCRINHVGSTGATSSHKLKDNWESDTEYAGATRTIPNDHFDRGHSYLHHHPRQQQQQQGQHNIISIPKKLPVQKRRYKKAKQVQSRDRIFPMFDEVDRDTASKQPLVSKIRT